jgi:peptide/nickel transport system permease protein
VRAARPVAADHPLAAYLARRLVSAVLVVLAASGLIFTAMALLPGDAADVILSKHAGSGAASEQAKAVLRAELGLDRPLPVRYADWVAGLARGDLGVSLLSGRPVAEIIGARLGNTLVLAGVAAALLVVVGIGLGLWAGARADRAADRMVSVTAISLGSLPEFVLAILLIQVFAFTWPLFPPISLVPPGASPLASPQVLVLPVLALVAVMAPQTIRMVRAQMAEVMDSPYVRMARLHGITERRIITHHALRNALAPAAPLLASSIAWLFGGVVVVETVFNYPGLSRDLVHGIATRDLLYVQALTLLCAAATVLVYLCADLVAVWAVPKLRTSGGRR